MYKYLRYRRATNSFCCFILLALSAISSTATGQSTWTNATNDNFWSNGANWTSGLPDQNDKAIFDSVGSVFVAAPHVAESLFITTAADQEFFNTSNGEIEFVNGDSDVWGAARLSGLPVQMGPGNLRIRGALSILDGSQWRSQGEVAIGNFSGFGLVVVDGENSRLSVVERLRVGDQNHGDGGLLILNDAKVFTDSVGIPPGSAVGIHGGTFHLGYTSIFATPRIVGSAGRVTGQIIDKGDLDLSTIANYFDDDLDWTDAVLRNRYVWVGATRVDTSFVNYGIVQAPASPSLHFLGYVENNGDINQEENGTIQTDRYFTNEESGSIELKGQLIADGHIRNRGHMEFNGVNTSIVGRFENYENSTLRTGAGKLVTFRERFNHNGSSFVTLAGGRSVFLGEVCANADFHGDGLLVFANEFAPGEGVETINFSPSTVFGDGSTINIEIGESAEYDQILFANDVTLNGPIAIELINSYQFQSEVFRVAGASDIQLGTSFSITPPSGYTANHSIIEENGNTWLRVALTAIPEVTVAPESIHITQGVLAAGTEVELGSSDNADLSIRRSPQSVQSIVQFVVNSTSPSLFPNEFRLRVESSVFARTTVNLKIEVFNFATDQYELLATESATRFTDSTFEHVLPDDPSHYMDPNSEMVARITFQSVAARQRFSANIDQVVWVIEK